MKEAHFIIFDNHKLIYGRVPKVANSSIKASLTDLLKLPPSKKFKTTTDTFWKAATNGETRMINIKELLRLRRTHFSFAFVRNPFDRLVSAYYNKIIQNKDLSIRMVGMGLTHGMSFPDFMAAIARTPGIQMDPHLMPQSDILIYEGAVVPTFVGRFEQLNEGWAELQIAMAKMGLDPLGQLPKKNVRREPGRSLREFFVNDELIQLAAETYKDDLRYFYSKISINQMVDMDLPGEMPKILRRHNQTFNGTQLGWVCRWISALKGKL